MNKKNFNSWSDDFSTFPYMTVILFQSYLLNNGAKRNHLLYLKIMFTAIRKKSYF